MHFRSATLVGVFLLVVTGMGCTGSTSGKQFQPEELRIKAIAVLYGRYISSHQGKTPPNEAELKKYVKAQDGAQLSAMGVNKDNIDEMFISPRDNQPFVVRYGVPVGAPDASGRFPVVAYEKQGQGGKRYVAYSSGQVEEIDEAKLKELVPQAK